MKYYIFNYSVNEMEGYQSGFSGIMTILVSILAGMPFWLSFWVIYICIYISLPIKKNDYDDAQRFSEMIIFLSLHLI